MRSEKRDGPDGERLVSDRLNELLARHRDEIAQRRLILRVDLEPGLVLDWPDSSDAIARLVGLAISTLPDGCELLVAATRSPERISRVGTGVVTLRWQVGRSGGAIHESPTDENRGQVVPIGAALRSAEDLIASAPVERIREACRESRLEFRLEPVDHSGEVIARVLIGREA